MCDRPLYGSTSTCLSEQIGPRVVSTPEEREAAEYIAAELEGYGYEVEIQESPRTTVHAYLTVQTPEQQVLDIRAGGLDEVSPVDYPLLTPDGGISAQVIYCGHGEAGAVAVLLHNTDWQSYGVRVAQAGGSQPIVQANAM